MREHGYSVIGMFGRKSLRGEYHRLVRQPRTFWLIVSVLTHFLQTKKHPEQAAAIFCVKHIQK